VRTMQPQAKEQQRKLALVSCNPSTWEAESGGLFELKASLGKIPSQKNKTKQNKTKRLVRWPIRQRHLPRDLSSIPRSM
ncbi:hypothetical protein ACQP3J_32740, partial [Escherichia coli]